MLGKRLLITLSEADKLWLEGYSRVHGISLAAAIRQGIATLKRSETQETYQKLVQNTRGLWRLGDGLYYQERLRSEWQS